MKGVFIWGWLAVQSVLCVAQIPIDKRESSDYMHYYEKGEKLYAERNYEDALLNYNQSLTLYAYHADSYYGRAATKEKLNNPEGALQDYTIFIELKPNQFDALFSRAVLLFNQEKWNLAIKDFIKLLQLPTGETATVYYKQERFTENTTQVFTSTGSNKAYLYNYVGLTQMELEDHKNARVYFDSAILANPSEPDYFVNSGKCFEALGMIGEARVAYQTAIQLNPDHSVANHNYAVLSRKVGELTDADRILDEVIAKNPTLPYPYAERAFIEFNKGEYKKALEDYNEAILLSPGEAAYWLNRGSVKEKMKDWSGALADFTQAIALNERLEKAWFSRANLFYKKALYVEAVKDYDIAIQLNPDYDIAFYNRALAKIKLNNLAEACQDLKFARDLGFEINPKVLGKTCGVQ